MMLRPAQVRNLATEALQETTAQHLRVEFALEREDGWAILFSNGREDWLVTVPHQEAQDEDRLRQVVTDRVRRLF